MGEEIGAPEFGVGEGVEPCDGEAVVGAEGVFAVFKAAVSTRLKGPPSAHSFPSERQVIFNTGGSTFPFFGSAPRETLSVTDFVAAGSKLPMVQDTTPFDHFQSLAEDDVQFVRPAGPEPGPELPGGPDGGPEPPGGPDASGGFGISMRVGEGVGELETTVGVPETFGVAAETGFPFGARETVSVTGK